MKKNLFFIAILLWTQTTEAASIESSTKGSIGKKSAACKGLGLCLPEQQSEGVLTFIFRYDNIERKLLVIFDEKEVVDKQPSAMDLLKMRKRFVVEEEVYLPLNLVSILGQSVKTISKGDYPIQNQNGKFIITISK